jgi:hypothetical protein
MTFVYIVRCRFTEPTKEQAWNDWYSGPKIAQMLSQPHFLTCQRFRRMAGTGRDYLALWTLQSPEALRTPEYAAQWGFADWAAYITDWSRDLFDGGATPEAAFAVPLPGGLKVVTFDGMSEAEAHRAQAQSVVSMWLPVIGLDRHTPMIGLTVLSDAAGAAVSLGANGGQAAVYRPICEVASRGTRV